MRHNQSEVGQALTHAKDRIASALILLLAVIVFVASGEFTFTSMLFPRMVSVVLGLCAVLMFLRTVSFRSGIAAAADGDPNVGQPFFRNPAHFAIFVVALIAYLIAISLLGYFASTALLVVILALALGFRDYRTLGLTTVLFLALVYGVFIMIFERPLPRGVLF